MRVCVSLNERKFLLPAIQFKQDVVSSSSLSQIIDFAQISGLMGAQQPVGNLTLAYIIPVCFASKHNHFSFIIVLHYEATGHQGPYV